MAWMLMKGSFLKNKDLDIMLGKMCSICRTAECKHWKGKVKCTESHSPYFQKGEVYNIMYGQLETEMGYSSRRYENVLEINEKHISKFEEVLD